MPSRPGSRATLPIVILADYGYLLPGGTSANKTAGTLATTLSRHSSRLQLVQTTLGQTKITDAGRLTPLDTSSLEQIAQCIAQRSHLLVTLLAQIIQPSKKAVDRHGYIISDAKIEEPTPPDQVFDAALGDLDCLFVRRLCRRSARSRLGIFHPGATATLPPSRRLVIEPAKVKTFHCAAEPRYEVVTCTYPLGSRNVRLSQPLGARRAGTLMPP